jgi:hypothetical protein
MTTRNKTKTYARTHYVYKTFKDMKSVIVSGNAIAQVTNCPFVVACDESHILAGNGTVVYTFGNPTVELYGDAKAYKGGPGKPAVMVLGRAAKDYTQTTPIARRMLTNAMRKTQTA